jgi:nitroimidazol reductase NimA-like FMN-containing flavoprotein (pyridoxamine 5'-phosphate oxidase superfamily)
MNTFKEAPASKVLGTHACWRSLRSASIGRLAVIGRTGPEIFPVNYLPEGESLIFRTGPGTKLDALLEGGAVALEADGLNPYGTIAWSVVVKGRPKAVPENGLDHDKLDRSLSPWEPGAKDLLFRITPTEITGRQFAIDPSARWWSPREP